jgi:hypothetical protein
VDNQYGAEREIVCDLRWKRSAEGIITSKIVYKEQSTFKLSISSGTTNMVPFV